MKSLRILTGHHAGAQLRLTHGLQRIGNDDEADIQITDWQHPPVQLTHDAESDTLMWLTLDGKDGNAGGPAPAARLLADFQPLRLGPVVLCVGPAELPWPSDAELLARLAAPAAVQAAARPLRRLWALGGAAAAGLLGLSVLSLTLLRPAAGAKAVPALPQQVRDALAGSGGGALRVRTIGPRVVVEGLLESSADVARVRMALQPFAGDRVMHRYSAAADVVRALGDAAGNARVDVLHTGGGVFAVRGQTQDLARLRDTLQRVAADLSPQVTRIDFQVTQDLMPARMRASASLLSEGLQYVEGPNGVRHLNVVQPAEPAASAPEPEAAASLAPAAPTVPFPSRRP